MSRCTSSACCCRSTSVDPSPNPFLRLARTFSFVRGNILVLTISGSLGMFSMLPLSGLFPITLPPTMEVVSRFVPLTYAVSLLFGKFTTH